MMRNNNYAQGSTKLNEPGSPIAPKSRDALLSERNSLELQIRQTDTDIENLEKYAMTNRHDREAVRDAEYDIAELEAKRNAIRTRIQEINAQLAKMPKVMARPAPVAAKSEFDNVRVQYKILQNEEYRLADTIDALHINMSVYDKNHPVYIQSELDLQGIEAQYTAVLDKLSNLRQELGRMKQK